MGDVAVLDVHDDGRGFDPTVLAGRVAAREHGGVGLPAMRERAASLGGEVVLESAPGRGTTLTVTVPAVAAAEAVA